MAKAPKKATKETTRTTSKSAAKRAQASPVAVALKRAVAKKAHRSTRAPDAIALLRADHKTVTELFDRFEKTRSSSRKKAIVSQVCLELTVHAQIEEEIFYPAVKAALKDKELVPEATVEHASVKELIAQVRDVEPDGEMYDARVRVMSEFVKHHVKEEQNEMFLRAKATRLDLVALGKELMTRKAELMARGQRTQSEKQGLDAAVAEIESKGKELAGDSFA